MTTDKRFKECEEMCEYRRVGANLCDLSNRQRVDCCPLNKIDKRFKTTEEIAQEFNNTPEWDDGIDKKQWISKENHEKEMKESFIKGYEKALDDHHILHGEDAKRFLKETGLDKLK